MLPPSTLTGRSNFVEKYFIFTGNISEDETLILIEGSFLVMSLERYRV